MNDNTAVTVVLCAFIVALAAVILGLAGISHATYIYAMQNGYEQKPDGRGGHVWVKACSKLSEFGSE